MAQIRFTVSDSEYAEINRYAKAKGHGGVSPASTFAHFAVFQYMAKYGLGGTRKEKDDSKYD